MIFRTVESTLALAAPSSLPRYWRSLMLRLQRPPNALKPGRRDGSESGGVAT